MSLGVMVERIECYGGYLRIRNSKIVDEEQRDMPGALNPINAPMWAPWRGRGR